MENFLITKCNAEDTEKIIDISKKTFYETFADTNSEEDMDNYLKENFSYDKMKKEIENEYSSFFIAYDGESVAAYMKVNFDKAQTESNHKNTLEVQRIYVLEKYKGKRIGKILIEKAKEIAKANNLKYIWLGVWENNFDAIRFYEKQSFVKFDTHIFVLGDDKQTDNLMKFTLS